MYSSVDTIWVLLGAILVFFMQAGFCAVETGLTRAKNAGNIIMKNLMDFALGTVCYWLVGFGIMFAGSSAVIGGIDFFMLKYVGGGYMAADSFPPYAFIIFQTVFCATAATIVSGAMAERTKFSSYCIYSVCISLFVYPISGHWIWGDGWLAQLGFMDFAGSTAVHMVGGVAALVGAAILGPRIGKYGKDGKPRAIPGHNLTMTALGVFILWMCWFGFNGASSVSMTGDDVLVKTSMVLVNTNLSAAVAASATMIVTWLRYKKPDVSMTLNGALAGLVGVTAGCDAVDPFGAAIIGLCSGIAVVFAVEFIDKVIKVDDPVGAIAVHGACGALGTILLGLLAVDGGVFYGGGFRLLGVQVLGVVATAAWVAVTMTVVFTLIRKTIGLRVTEQEEIEGLDKHEHGLSSSYADFMPLSLGPEDMGLGNAPLEDTAVAAVEPGATPAADTDLVPAAATVREPGCYGPITRLSIVCKKDRFEALKSAMNKIGITGMTVTQVVGCGVQKGSTELYRGAPVDMTLLPKVKVDIVVSKVPVEKVIQTAKDVLQTGNIGDGKIFVYDVENVVKVRTGEEGPLALQDVE